MLVAPSSARALILGLVLLTVALPRITIGAPPAMDQDATGRLIIRLTRTISTMAFVNGTVLVVTFSGLAFNREIALVDLPTGQVKTLDRGGCGSPSPDGTRIAWIPGPSSRGDVWTLDLSTNQRRRITEGLNAGCVSWSPDGKHFVVTATSKTSRLGDDAVIVAADTGGMKHIIAAESGGGGGGVNDPSWYRDAYRVGFSTWKLAGSSLLGDGIDIFDMRVQRRVRILDAPRNQLISDLAVSPDGRTLLFVASARLDVPEGERRSAPHIFAFDGNVIRLIARGHLPAWLPDGRSIFFARAYDCTDVVCAGDEIFSLTISEK